MLHSILILIYKISQCCFIMQADKLERLRERMGKVRDLFRDTDSTEFVIVTIPTVRIFKSSSISIVCLVVEMVYLLCFVLPFGLSLHQMNRVLVDMIVGWLLSLLLSDLRCWKKIVWAVCFYHNY